MGKLGERRSRKINGQERSEDGQEEGKEVMLTRSEKAVKKKDGGKNGSKEIRKEGQNREIDQLEGRNEG